MYWKIHSPRPSRLPSGFALGQSLGPQGAKSPPLGNLLGLGECIFQYIPPLGSVRIQYIPPLGNVHIHYPRIPHTCDNRDNCSQNDANIKIFEKSTCEDCHRGSVTNRSVSFALQPANSLGLFRQLLITILE